MTTGGNGLSKSLTTMIMNKLASPSIGLWFYDFRINPTQVVFTQGKLQTMTEYGWGYYDLEHFGNAFTNIAVNGTTGVMYPEPDVMRLLSDHSKVWSGFDAFSREMGTATDFRLSLGYTKFEILRKLYGSSHQQILFVLLGKGYFGFFDTFTFTMDAENPRRINYEFVFKAHPQLVFDIFSMDFSGIKSLGSILNPKDVKLTTMSNASQFTVVNPTVSTDTLPITEPGMEPGFLLL